SHKDQTLANNKIAILTASGWQSVGELAKAGISFGAVPQTQMIYQANEFYAFDAHDVAIADTFSVAILNASLEHFYNLVLHQNIAVFSSPDGSGKTTSKIRNLQFRPKGGPERHKHGWALLHDGFGTGYRDTTEGGVFRRRLWLPRVVNAGSAPFQMSDDTQQAIVARFMVMQSNIVDKIKNIQLANSNDGSGGVGYLDNQQPPIEYWEDC
ncbi:MAG: hypothetical protein OXG15_04245, partial [Gammaproteobacteria bacterium]|nr:hypothetical protein [Gammaproteobacteria bacterium]